MPYNNLAKANRQGYIIFLALNSLYPRVALALAAAFFTLSAGLSFSVDAHNFNVGGAR